MSDYTIKALYTAKPAENMNNVTVNGWVRTMRESKTFAFVELNDGTYFKNLQIILDEAVLADYRALVKAITVGASLTVTGTLVMTPEMKQPFELRAESAEVLGESPVDYPLQKKRHTLEYMRTIAHLRPRANLFQCAYRIRSIAAQAVHRFFHDRGFVYVNTPLITGSDCEGAGEMFQVTTLDLNNVPKTEDGQVDYSQDFFGKPVSLTVSGQLNAETLALAFNKVYTFGPTFRAERSNTQRHAAEFWMIEPEIAFATLKEDMDLQEDMIKYIIDAVLTEAPEEMKFLDGFVQKGLIDRLTAVRDADFGRVSYTEAVKILEESGHEFEYKPYWGCDLQTEHERYLTEQVFGKPVFVTDYPKEIKAFYMRANDDGKTVAAADLLVPGVGELCGGSQREERLDVLTARIEELGMKPADYWWYLDLRKYGTVKHAGFGMGFERMIMYLTGISNIRDVLPFPRTTGSAEF
ncbi:MAG: asparagine--tRNA ligase [Clostridiales bacterium]|nr:asparagine--tRNA ligase [Clostridiales bacterium]MDD7366657.1 asparagine--tRNA ligase [Clostridiales bacterium]MDY2873570.1 asparagine--tRNA ligase [Eubacteriales bacterium]